MGIVKDMRYALRVLLKNPAFTAVAIITLALGIGVNATVFSVVNTYLFKPLPVKDAGQLVAIAGKSRSFEFPLQVSYGDYKDIAGQTNVFSGALAYEDDPVNMSFGGSPQRIWTELVTGNYFSLLGIDATIGRTFTPEEGRFPGGAPVMVLSYNFWQKQFGGDRSAVGKTVRLDGSAFTIIGVAPESFRGTFPLISPDAYAPAGARGLLFEGGDQTFATRSSNPLRLIARLNSGVSVDQAQAALGVLASRLQQQYPDTNRDLGFIAVPETHSRPVLEVASTFDKISLIFMILVGLVLLIACANVANLMLARATARQKELAIRNALGASRSSLVRLFLSEALLLSFAGGVFGLLLGYWASRYMSGLQFSMGAPISFHFAIDLRVFFFTAAAVLTTTLLAGLLPAIRASRPDISETLKEGGRGNSGDGGWQRLR
ncbi:MAG: ABC transporter permease, partial [Blastocatellia bacterium]